MNGTIMRHQIEKEHVESERELVDVVEIVYLSLSVCIGTLLNSVAVVRLLRYSKSPSSQAKHHCLVRPLHMNPFAMFKFNLAITDFAILFIHALGKMVWLLSYRWLFGDFGCRLYQFLSAFVYYSNSNVIVAIGLDRLKVVYSGQMQCVSSCTRRVRIFLLIAWLLAALCALPQLFFWTNFELGLGWSQCTTIWQIAEYTQTTNLISRVNFTTTISDIQQQKKDHSWSAHANTQLLYELLHQVIVFIIPLISLSASYLLIVVRVLRYSLRPPPNSNLCSFRGLKCAAQWAADDGQPTDCEGTREGGGQWPKANNRRGRRSANTRNFLRRLHLLRQSGGEEHLLRPSFSSSSGRTFNKLSTTKNATNRCFGPPQNAAKNKNGKNGICRQCAAPPPSPNLFTSDGQAHDKNNGTECQTRTTTTAFEVQFPLFVEENGTKSTDDRRPIIAESANEQLLILLAKKAATNEAEKGAKSDESGKRNGGMELCNFPQWHRFRPNRRGFSPLFVNTLVPPSAEEAGEHHYVSHRSQEVISSFCASNSSTRPLMPRGVVRPQMLPRAMPGGVGIAAGQHRTMFFAGRQPSAVGEATGASVGAPISPLWRRQMRSKVFIRSLLIVAAHCAFWLPYNLLNLLRFTDETLYNELVDRGALLVEDLIIMNSLINPVLYGYGK
ncbi:hypothetical protein niasHS_002855 [Heterodera schachtii]|uniref:G-protein coupled receptors family 1 profile domain-containing protein n=1 Tax=Heterodera schachtii TaxID=97005 RepID=A0ABD2K2N2_HETSC